MEGYSDAKLISQGAEGRIWLTHKYKYSPSGECIIKERFEKQYRHPQLEAQLSMRRLRAESKNAARAREIGIRAPQIYFCDRKRRLLFMEHLRGPTLKQTFLSHPQESTPANISLARGLGSLLRKMHAHNLVHGDLTTSNVIVLDQKEDEICLIDWGLSSVSTLAEDMAVDLYVLERAWTSTHPQQTALFWELIDAYKNYSEFELEGAITARAVLSRYRKVRLRGRKRDMSG